MIFQHTFDLVLNCQKTQTRRVIKPNEYAVRTRHNRIRAIMHNDRPKWVVGQTYAVQPKRGQKQVAQIKITALNSQRVRNISTEDAIAEGFENRQSFFNIWRTMYGEDSLDLPVWIVKFELVGIAVDLDEYNAITHREDLVYANQRPYRIGESLP
jgi:hypothetical protein